MNPFDTIGTFFVGLIKEGHLQAWYKLAVSCLATIFVTFFGTFGLTGLALINSQNNYTLILVISLLTACLHTALAVLVLWMKSPLTKGIPIAYFGKIEAKRLEVLSSEGSVFNPNDKR